MPLGRTLSFLQVENYNKKKFGKFSPVQSINAVAKLDVREIPTATACCYYDCCCGCCQQACRLSGALCLTCIVSNSQNSLWRSDLLSWSHVPGAHRSERLAGWSRGRQLIRGDSVQTRACLTLAQAPPQDSARRAKAALVSDPRSLIWK